MGVADNKSYKDMYHFNDNFFNKTDKKDYPSLNVDPDINSTIKENPYRSNVEIEGDELVLQPDLSALFKAVGKKHSGGGMDVNLRPNSFVFSDDKSLALTKTELELFQFKKGGKYKPTNHTPAMVVKKNVNPEKYNTMISNITSLKKDDLAKKSSAMMLEKYIETLGQIAYIQERKKGLPQGVPDFSSGTAPVYLPEVKTAIDEQKQYAKYGGKINPYMDDGGLTDPCPCGKDANGDCITDCPPSTYVNILNTQAKKVDSPLPGYNKLFTDRNKNLFGKFGTDTPIYNVPQAVKGNGQMTEQWKNKIQSMIKQGATLDQLVAAGHGTKQGLQNLFQFPAISTPDDYIYTEDNPVPPGYNPPPVKPPTVYNNPHPDEVNGNGQAPLTAPWQFTPWQKISQGYNALKYATAQRYMPTRSRYDATYNEDYLVNPEQAVGDVKGLANQQVNSLTSLSPILRNAQASSAYGQYLNQVPGIRSQYENQNAQIVNQGRQYRNQVKNQESLQNMQNDQSYYRESVVGRQNFDNLRGFLGDQYMNNLIGDVETNQTLAYNLLSRDNPAYNFDWRSGNFTPNPNRSVMNVKGNGAKDELTSVMEVINQIGDPYQKAQALTKLYGLKVFGPAIQSTYKKGGKYNPYK